MPSNKLDLDLQQKVIREYEEDHTEHRNRVTEYDRRYKAYRAMRDFEKAAKAEERGQSVKPMPAYVFQSVETMVSNLVDSRPKWRIRVLPQMGDDIALLEEKIKGARANEILLQHQLSLDHWAEKQRTFDLQGLICGVTASKQSWVYREGPKRSIERYSLPQLNLWGEETSRLEGYNEKVEGTQVYRDDPTAEILDVRHLIFQKGRSSLQNSERITHRVFKSMDELRRQECKRAGGRFHEGPCEPGKYYHNLDELEKVAGEGKGVTSDRFQREADLFGENPHSGDIELWEQWRLEGDEVRCVTIAGQSVMIGNRLSPFWLDGLDHPYPFAVCSGTPDLFKMNGISEVEVMAELQQMLWMLIHQRLTNVELVNNAIMLIADDVIDPDEFEPEPGARFLVPRPVQETVQWWAPDIRVADLSMQAEAMLKGDLQNVTGGMPFLSGTDTSGVDQETATGVSIVTSLAQKRLAAKRQQFVWAKGRIGEQWSKLNQQFIREDRLVPIIGRDGAEAFEQVHPELLQGSFRFDVEMAEESMMRQEKRAEMQALLQVAGQMSAPMAMSGAALNLKAFMDDLLDAYDIQDKDRYYSQQNPLPPGVQPGQPGQPGAEAPTQGPGGVTNPEAAAGQLAPSNTNSMSPEAMMQQFMANRGQVQ